MFADILGANIALTNFDVINSYLTITEILGCFVNCAPS